MAQTLLIHGAGHGAWCWRDLIPELQAAGHQGHTMDLPGHGDDRTPLEEVTLAAYGDAIAAKLRQIGEPTLLIGHSMGGYPITLAAEICPELVAGLVYLCAYVPAPDQSLNDRRREASEQPLLEALCLSQDGLGWTVTDSALDHLFYHDCPPGTVAYARQHLCVQAREPSSRAINLTAASQSLPRYYIRCLRDRTIPPDHQMTMSGGIPQMSSLQQVDTPVHRGSDWPSRNIFTMDCGHSPFFADPRGLARHIHTIAHDLRLT
jgi:pimeloyl-ACP methyl ester carboxylesterase